MLIREDVSLPKMSTVIGSLLLAEYPHSGDPIPPPVTISLNNKPSPLEL